MTPGGSAGPRAEAEAYTDRALSNQDSEAWVELTGADYAEHISTAYLAGWSAALSEPTPAEVNAALAPIYDHEPFTLCGEPELAAVRAALHSFIEARKAGAT